MYESSLNIFNRIVYRIFNRIFNRIFIRVLHLIYCFKMI